MQRARRASRQTKQISDSTNNRVRIAYYDGCIYHTKSSDALDSQVGVGNSVRGSLGRHACSANWMPFGGCKCLDKVFDGRIGGNIQGSPSAERFEYEPFPW